MYCKRLLSEWGLLVGLLFAAGAAGLFAIDVQLLGQSGAQNARLAGLGMLTLAVFVLLASLWAWVSGRGDSQEFSAYGCDKCGYTPRRKDVERGRSVPCPRCNEPLYLKK